MFHMATAPVAGDVEPEKMKLGIMLLNRLLGEVVAYTVNDKWHMLST